MSKQLEIRQTDDERRKGKRENWIGDGINKELMGELLILKSVKIRNELSNNFSNVPISFSKNNWMTNIIGKNHKITVKA